MNISIRIATSIAVFTVGTYQAFSQDGVQINTNSSSLWNMIEQGGWAMVPLGICSLALIYLIIHCSRETKPSRFGNELFGERIASLCKNGKLAEAFSAAGGASHCILVGLPSALPAVSKVTRVISPHNPSRSRKGEIGYSVW